MKHAKPRRSKNNNKTGNEIATQKFTLEISVSNKFTTPTLVYRNPGKFKNILFKKIS
jgi:hypothetical protein